MGDPADRVALVDLDGTIADYDSALRAGMRVLQAPNESVYIGRAETDVEPPFLEARRKLVQRQPGFWRSLGRIERGFEIVDELRSLGFLLHVLTKGPTTTPSAWSEKLEWCQQHLPDAVVTVTGDKSLVYGRVLIDDFPPYFTKWIAVRPRGLVVCVAHPWNAAFAKGGAKAHPHVIRYDGSNLAEVRAALQNAYGRESGQPLLGAP
jgi:5'(3')-deoxyribonucleotidase